MSGWVWFPDQPEEVATVRVLVDGKAAATGPADLYRQDLEHKKPGGLCGFDLELERADAPFRLDIEVVGHAGALEHGPLLIEDAAAKLRLGPAGAIVTARPRPPETLPAQTSWNLRGKGVKGRLIDVDERRLSGWVYCSEAPADRLRVVLFCDGEPSGETTASLPVPGLRESGRGDGEYGFAFETPEKLLDGAPHVIDLRIQDQTTGLLAEPIGVQLIHDEAEKPRLHTLSARPATPEPAKKTRSKTAVAPVAPRAPYLDTPEALAALAEPAWEHLMGDGAPRRAALERFADALRRERASLVAEVAPGTKGLLLVLATPSDDERGLTSSLRTWALQSHPYTDHLVVHSGESAGSGAPDSCVEPEALRTRAVEADWCVFARPGDAIHPSTTAVLDRHGATTDVLVWSTLVPDRFSRSGGVVFRRPVYDPHTVRHNPSVDTAFAVRGAALRDCPAAVLAALIAGHPHPLLFWLTTRSDLRWRTWPQALTVRSGGADDDVCSRAAVSGNLELYFELSKALAGAFDLRETRPDLPVPFLLAPSVRPQRISIILLVEEGEDHRALRSLFSIACQRTTAVLEVVLVGPGASLAAAAAQRMFGHERVQVARAERGGTSHDFNAAAAAATGEVLVFYGHDLKAPEDETIVEELAAWALLPGVATVGCGLQEPGPTGRTSFGLTGAPASPDLFAPVLIPDQDPAFAETIHACAGNVLTLAAIRRQTFLAVGGLDAARFPAALNDVELMLRCARSGLVHIYLGHLRAQLDADAPVAIEDPTAAVQLRQLYPEAGQASLFTLGRRAIPTAASGPPGTAPGPYSSEDLEQLAQAAARRSDLDDEVRRAILGEVAKVSEASGSLLEALERLQAMTSVL